MGKHSVLAILSLLGGLLVTYSYKIARQRGMVFSSITMIRVALLVIVLFALFEVLSWAKDRFFIPMRHYLFGFFSIVSAFIGTCVYKAVRHRGIVFSEMTMVRMALLIFVLFMLFEGIFWARNRFQIPQRHFYTGATSLLMAVIGAVAYKIVRHRGVVFSTVTLLRIALLAFVFFAVLEIYFLIKDRAPALKKHYFLGVMSVMVTITGVCIYKVLKYGMIGCSSVTLLKGLGITAGLFLFLELILWLNEKYGIIAFVTGYSLSLGRVLKQGAEKHIYVYRATMFLLIASVLFGGLCSFLQPAWKSWSNFDTIHGFYQEPDNTIETIFLGTSAMVNGITPMEMYKQYGICAYNLGFEQQPMLGCYYWTEEAYRLHGDTLKTVVLDASGLRKRPALAFYQKAIDGMKLSSVKYRAVKDLVGDTGSVLSYLVPAFEYHNRWTSIVEDDVEKYEFPVADYVRGYSFSTARYFDNANYDSLALSLFFSDNTAQASQFVETPLYYLNKMIDFCNAHDIKLVLIKIPVGPSWTSGDHNATQAIADQYGLDFLDYNFEPYIDEMGYNHAVDSADGGHMNYFGARKLSLCIGKYLIENCNGTDVRNDQRYSFMKEQEREYDGEILAQLQRKEITDLKEYLNEALSNEDYEILITAKDDAANALTDETRGWLREKGFSVLPELSYRSSYYGIIDSGEVIAEDTDIYDPETDGLAAEIDNNIKEAELSINFDEEEPLTISEEGKLPDGTPFKIESGGLVFGNKASCLINGVEYSKNGRGLNIVIYNKKKGSVADAAVFDTCASEIREPWDLETALKNAKDNGVEFESMSAGLQKLSLYNYRMSDQYNIGLLRGQINENGAWQFIRVYMNRPDARIIIAVQEDAAGKMDDKARKAFRKLGFTELSDIEDDDSYIGIVEDGKVTDEMRDHGEKPISLTSHEYSVISGGLDSGNISSIKVYETEYSKLSKGLNIVVYDKLQRKVIDSAVYNTSENGVELFPIDIDWDVKR